MIKKSLYFTNPAYLSLKNQQLWIEQIYKEAKAVSIPIEDIALVLLEHNQITITHPCMNALLKANAALIICDEKKMPSGIMLPIEGAHTQTEKYRYQIEASVPLKKQLWQQTIIAKINNQAAVLNRIGKGAKPMEYFVKEVKSGDSGNMEARAAVHYWQHIFSDFVEEFTRSREGDMPNAMLNYGYAILRAIVARALVSTGLLPSLGIFHKSKYNAYCLADDIMEPYRPYVDNMVYEYILENGMPKDITKEVKSYLLQIAQVDVQFEDKTSPLLIGVSRTTASLAKCFEGELRKMVYPQF